MPAVAGRVRTHQSKFAPPYTYVVPEFSPGLEGVVAAQTAISEVDGANGRLIYRGGYLIEDLAPVVTYEEVAYLLWHGELPNQTQLDEQCKVMAAARHLNKAAQGALLAMDPATETRTLVARPSPDTSFMTF